MDMNLASRSAAAEEEEAWAPGRPRRRRRPRRRERRGRVMREWYLRSVDAADGALLLLLYLPSSSSVRRFVARSILSVTILVSRWWVRYPRGLG